MKIQIDYYVNTFQTDRFNACVALTGWSDNWKRTVRSK